MRTEERISNYERQAEAARKLFLTYDQERILLRYDLAADRQWIFLTYLNVPCRISRESGQVEEQQEDGRWKWCDSFHTVMTVYDLLCYSRGEQVPAAAGRWCTAGSFMPVTSPDAGTFAKRYGACFQDHTEELKTACAGMGGRIEKSIAGADVTCRIPVISSFPMLLQFWEGDEEFEPKVMILWDENALEFLHFETLFYLQEDLLKRLSEKMKV